MLTLFNMGQFGTAQGWWEERGSKRPLFVPKFFRTYPTMMKLGKVIPYI